MARRKRTIRPSLGFAAPRSRRQGEGKNRPLAPRFYSGRAIFFEFFAGHRHYRRGQEFEDSLPDFKSLDKEQHLEFVKAIRLLCRYFDISEGRLQKDHCFKLRSTVARLSELYDEYSTRTQSLRRRYCLLSCILSHIISMIRTPI
jgi:hypothetical protein